MPEFHAADSILKCVFKLNISHPVAMYTCKSSDCTVEAALQDMQTPGSTAPAVLLWQSQRIARACPSEASTPEKPLKSAEIGRGSQQSQAAELLRRSGGHRERLGWCQELHRSQGPMKDSKILQATLGEIHFKRSGYSRNVSKCSFHVFSRWICLPASSCFTVVSQFFTCRMGHGIAGETTKLCSHRAMDMAQLWTSPLGADLQFNTS